MSNRTQSSFRTPRLGVAVAAFACLLTAASASAQQAYVGAGLIADFARFDRFESGFGGTRTGGGEALGFSLRLGAPIARRFGVELEFVRPSLIESEERPDVFPLLASGMPTVGTSPAVTVPAGGQVVQNLLPTRIQNFTIRTSRRYTTVSASVWAEQEVSRRVALAYLGGMAFHRSEFETRQDFRRLGLPVSIFPVDFSSTSLLYTVRPMAGFEARIGLTDHVRFVPGIRMHGIGNGWLVRPGIALDWVL